MEFLKYQNPQREPGVFQRSERIFWTNLFTKWILIIIVKDLIWVEGTTHQAAVRCINVVSSVIVTGFASFVHIARLIKDISPGVMSFVIDCLVGPHCCSRTTALPCVTLRSNSSPSNVSGCISMFYLRPRPRIRFEQAWTCRFCCRSSPGLTEPAAPAVSEGWGTWPRLSKTVASSLKTTGRPICGMCAVCSRSTGGSADPRSTTWWAPFWQSPACICQSRIKC